LGHAIHNGNDTPAAEICKGADHQFNSLMVMVQQQTTTQRSCCCCNFGRNVAQVMIWQQKCKASCRETQANKRCCNSLQTVTARSKRKQVKLFTHTYIHTSE